MRKMTVDLGFVENCEPWRLESRFFPSKVGGKPAWLDLKSIPGKKELECDYCKNPCIFLCQVYAPYEEDDAAFHRTIYVFICKNAECCKANENGNVKVFRSQLDRFNDFYPPEPPVEEEDWRTDINVKQWSKTCWVCGIKALNHCSKCKSTNYCCRAHQVYDWKYEHKNSCGNSSSKSNNFVFPEYELVIESEEITKGNVDSNDPEKEKKELEKYRIMIENDEAGSMQKEAVNDELIKMANSEEDETFSEFRGRIDKYPEQILRYDRGGKILYISSNSQIEDIPRCTECEGERQFEFQIMPQLLNFLNFNDSFKCLDWGILGIFTCKRSCLPKNGYVKEYIWKQDIVQSKSDIAS